MRRPRQFWAAAAGVVLGGLGAVDLWANFNDVQGDTASEQFRSLRLPDWALALGLAGLYVHLKRRHGEFTHKDGGREGQLPTA